jgi:hypothetical protein
MRRPTLALVGATAVVLLVGGAVYAVNRSGNGPSDPGVTSTTPTSKSSWSHSRMSSATPMPLPAASSPDATTP